MDLNRPEETNWPAAPRASNAPSAAPERKAEAAPAPLINCLDEFEPPLSLVSPSSQTTPLVFSSPHSGRTYPKAFLEASRLDRLEIRRSEDAYVEELFSAMPGFGAPLLAARFPRAFCDVNREAFELDPEMFTSDLPSFAKTDGLRVANGLGTIARVVADGAEIYRHKLSFEDARARIDQLYRPYHDTLKGLLENTKGKFGRAILIDCHSMPSPSSSLSSRSRYQSGHPDIVLGDRFGTACDRAFTDALEAALTAEGFLVGRNDPFAGGFCTEYYGQPHTGIHAVQIEIRRSLYMNERTMKRRTSLELLKSKLTRIFEKLAREELA